MKAIINDYYLIEGRSDESGETVFSVRLLPECRVYAGHFPGNPISPGVYNMQMIRELAELLLGKRLFIGYIERCRMSAIVAPHATPRLKARIKLSPIDEGEYSYQMHATLFDETNVYMELKLKYKDAPE